MAIKANELQQCINMIEALVDTESEAKNFRMHCHDIIKCAQSLHPILLRLQKELPEIVDANGTNPIFHKLNKLLEEALLVIRKTAQFGTMEKILDHGESKHKLDDILASLQSACREMDAFVAGYENLLTLGESSNPEKTSIIKSSNFLKYNVTLYALTLAYPLTYHVKNSNVVKLYITSQFPEISQAQGPLSFGIKEQCNHIFIWVNSFLFRDRNFLASPLREIKMCLEIAMGNLDEPNEVLVGD
ncbi:hypothetical protein SELMODRAFT_431747 [Selaginella moellendorffii]|uniref:Uncharacterized protein n=1 Tax=Selaginella moellendorffii TaxID=88036 RepID=D8TDN1_SELML|nr:hypothetical protein SELMODRAFT_431747 [Selaginella moellendorffii]